MRNSFLFTAIYKDGLDMQFNGIEADRLFFLAQWDTYNLLGRVWNGGALQNNGIVPVVLEATA